MRTTDNQSLNLKWYLKDSETISNGNNIFFDFFNIEKSSNSIEIRHVFQNDQLEEQLTYNRGVFQTKTSNNKIHLFMKNQEAFEVLVHRQPILNEQNEVIEVACDAYFNVTQALIERICDIKENQFRDLIEEVSDLIAITDQNGAFQYVSPQWETLLGYKPYELIGKSRKDIMNPEDAQSMLKAFSPYYQKHLPFSMLETDLITKNKRIVTLDSSGTPIFNSEGQFVGYRVISRDITIRKRFQKKSQHLNKYLEKLVSSKDKDIITRNEAINLFASYQEVINQISRKIINSPFDDLKNSIRGSLRMIGELAGVDRVYIFTFNEDHTEMSNTYEWHSPEVEPAIEDLQNLDSNIFPWWMQQLKQDKVINVFDVNKMSKNQTNEKKILQMQNIKSVLVVPLHIENELIGFLGFDSVIDSKKWDVEVQLLRMLGEIVAFTIRRQQSEEKVHTSLERVQKLFLETIEAFSSIIEYIDPYTAVHQKKVAELAQMIAEKMGLSYDVIQTVYLASMLHDLGKIYVPTQILNKPSKLTELEFELLKTHPVSGYEIVRKIDFPWPIADIIMQHHERLDGSGYPYGLKEDEIMLETKILMVADIIEAITTHRPYRPAHSLDYLLKELNRGKNTLYDGQVVDVCIELLKNNELKI